MSPVLQPKCLPKLLTPDSRYLLVIFPQCKHIQDLKQFSSEITHLIFNICCLFHPSTHILYGKKPEILHLCSSVSFFNASEHIARLIRKTNFLANMQLSYNIYELFVLIKETFFNSTEISHISPSKNTQGRIPKKAPTQRLQQPAAANDGRAFQAASQSKTSKLPWQYKATHTL